jgi:hydrogenase maturation protein HypF
VDDTTLAEAGEGYPFFTTTHLIDLPSPPAVGEKVRVRGSVANFNSPVALDPTPMWPALLDDLERRMPAHLMAARFHLGLARAIVELVSSLKLESVQSTTSGPGGLKPTLQPVSQDRHAFDTIALSGGVFQNKTLLEQVARGLRAKGFVVITHRQVPANDGGLSLGQAAVAAARRLKTIDSKTRLPICV